MTLAPATLDVADGYWAAFLGVAREDLRPAAPLAVPHGEGLADYRGMYAQSFGAAPVVSLPAGLLERFGAPAAEQAGRGLVDDERWRAVFGARMDVVVGPAAIAYADSGTLADPDVEVVARRLGEADRAALDGLRHAVPALAWDHGGSQLGEETPVVGVFVEGVLAAAAGYEVWGGRIAHLAIATHPAHRGRGLGAAAVAIAARMALGAGLVAQYRALQSNTHSLSIARRLGFVPYATSLAVRLRDA